MSTWPTLAPKSADVSVCGDDAIGTRVSTIARTTPPRRRRSEPPLHPNAAKKSGEKANAAALRGRAGARAKITDAPAAVSEPEFARREGFEEVSNPLDARAVSSVLAPRPRPRRGARLWRVDPRGGGEALAFVRAGEEERPSVAS